MNSPEYVWKNPNDGSFLLNVYSVEFGDRRVCIATLVDSDTETEEIVGFGESVDDALWDMADGQSPVRNFAIHALFDRYTRNMGKWSDSDRKLLQIEYDRDCVKIIRPCISRLSGAIGLFMKPYYTM